MNRESSFSKKHHSGIFSVSLIILILYLSPLIILGEHSIILEHDNLDSNIPHYKVLSESGKIFAPLDAKIPQIMNGLPRNVFHSEFNIILWFYFFLRPINAYILNFIIIHLVAFFGMFLLLKKHLLKDQMDNMIVVGVSLCYSLLPFYPTGGLSVAGLPLALYAFMNFRDSTHTIKDWLIIFLLPFYSSFVFSFVFFIFFMFLLGIFDIFKKRKNQKYFWMAIFFMLLFFSFTNYRLIYSIFLEHDYVSHRIEFSGTWDSTNWSGVMNKFGQNFINGHYHAHSLHSDFIGLSVFLSLVTIIFTAIKGKKYNNLLIIFCFLIFLTNLLQRISFIMGSNICWIYCSRIIMILIIIFIIPISIIFYFYKIDSKKEKILILLLFFCFSISLFYGVYSWNVFDTLKQNIDILRTFNFTRFIILQPLLWYLIFALSLSILCEKVRYGKVLVMLLIALQIVLLFTYTDSLVQTGGFGQIMSFMKEDGIPYNQYYATSLFEDIKRHINRDQEEYRVVSIGLPPEIAQYNGFYSIDGYRPNYPLYYKHQFREIISKELEKNDKNRKYFDNWGSRCYVFVDEISEENKNVVFVGGKNEENRIIQNMELNTKSLKNMNVEYVFSAVEIQNYKENNLKLIKKFENNKSHWNVWVYST